LKSNRIKIIKSRRLKNKKYKKKTRVRLHLGKNKQRGGARCEIDFSDRDTLYVNYINEKSGKNYLYKLNLIDKIFETYDPEKGDYVNPRPLKEITRNLRRAILKTMDQSNDTDKQEIMEIFIEHDIDPLLPMKISPSPPPSLSSSRKSSSSAREPSPKALGRVTPLKMEKLKDAMNFAKTYKSKSNQLSPLRSRPSVFDIMKGSPYLEKLPRRSSQSIGTRKNKKPLQNQ
jgi:hypothetical protein